MGPLTSLPGLAQLIRGLAVVVAACLSNCFVGCGNGHGGNGTGGSAGCAAGEARCDGSCVDISTDPAHCGTCSHACGAEHSCEEGRCVASAPMCPAGLTRCVDECVDTSGDAANCGACATSCAVGRSCISGVCRCRVGTIACGDDCADITSDAANCGACGVSCATSRVCDGARCVCGTGRVECGADCVDTTSDRQNCGSCGVTCTWGQSCVEGSCAGGGASGPDGCSGLARGISVTAIAVYQSVSVPIMRDGAEISRGARNADVVAGRDALFRVFVTTDSGGSARPLSARVFVRNANGSQAYFAKTTLAAASQEAVLASTFQVVVPKSEITSDARYAVEIVECGAAPSAELRSPRYPTAADVMLGARETGGLKVRLIPLLANAYVPDTSELALAQYRALLMAMYPITSLDFDLGAPLNVEDPEDWNGMLDEVRNRRELDQPAPDVYYYGLLKPAATLEDYCASGCMAGIGFVPQGTATQQASQRAALGLAFADAASAETMAHEVGHNHGRDHAPCPQWGIGGVDSKYPYPGAATGVYGWDARFDALMPPTSTDIMGYCSRKWISDYTYAGLVNRVAFVNGASASEIFEPNAEPHLVLLVDSRGARWGRPRKRPSPPAGVPESAELLDGGGHVAGTVTVYRSVVSDVTAHSIQVPARAAAWKALRLRDGTRIRFP